jgi:hypothetical protein
MCSLRYQRPAVVEPKEKSQNPAASSEAPQGATNEPRFRRGRVGRSSGCTNADLHRKYKAMMDERLSCQRSGVPG